MNIHSKQLKIISLLVVAVWWKFVKMQVPGLKTFELVPMIDCLNITILGRLVSLPRTKVGNNLVVFYVLVSKESLEVAVNMLVSFWKLGTSDVVILCSDDETYMFFKDHGFEAIYLKEVQQIADGAFDDTKMGLAKAMYYRETLNLHIVLTGGSFVMLDVDTVLTVPINQILLAHDDENVDIVVDGIWANFEPGVYCYPFLKTDGKEPSCVVLNNGLIYTNGNSENVRQFYLDFYAEILAQSCWSKGFGQTAFGRVLHRGNLELRFVPGGDFGWIGNSPYYDLKIGTFSSAVANNGPKSQLFHAVYGNTNKTGAWGAKKGLIQEAGLWFLKENWFAKVSNIGMKKHIFFATVAKDGR